MTRLRLLCTSVCLPFIGSDWVQSAELGEVSFSRDIAPIFQQHCTGCHREGKAKGKYRIDNYTHAMKSLVAGKIGESELYDRITTDDPEDRMPVDAEPLDPNDIAVIRKWIEQGAAYDADDPDAPLSAIMPVIPHPAAPATYSRAVPVTAMAFAENGGELFTGGYHEILIWNPDDARLLRRVPDNGQRTYDLALSPDGKMLAAATGTPGEAGELRIFDAKSGEVIATPVRTDDIALCVAFDPAGTRLAFGASDGRLRIFDTATWEESLVLTAHSDWINALDWNADGSRLATAGRDKTAKVFDLSAGGKRLITFSGHTEAVRGVAFHPNADEVISCGDDGLLLRWKIGDGKKSADLANFGGHAHRLIASESGYFGAGANGLAVQFALADQKRLREFRANPSPAAFAGCAVHGNRLAIGTFDGRVVFFDLESGEQTVNFVASPGH